MKKKIEIKIEKRIEKIIENETEKKTEKQTQKIVISYPKMGKYHIPIGNFLRKILKNVIIIEGLPITKKTIELGEKYSPDFVCVPFKYNLGNYIESIENGANVLIQAGGGCRFGYYGDVQEIILKKLGYNITFLKICNTHAFNILSYYNMLKKIDNKLNIFNFIHNAKIMLKQIEAMDIVEGYIRINGTGEEYYKGNNIFNLFIKDLIQTNSIIEIKRTMKYYLSRLKSIIENREKNCVDCNDLRIKIGIVGELYTTMEPFSSANIEDTLMKQGIIVKRYINLSYLLNSKLKNEQRLLDRAKKYIKYPIGADGTESVAHSIELAENNFDGIIHFKPFGCTPEINAMPIIKRISEDYSIPVLFFSFDAQTSETGIITRIEAFIDMLKMKKTPQG